MSHPIEASIIRILRSDGSIAGTGFLVSKGLAVTCAHVAAHPGETIEVQFTGQDAKFPASVIPEYWRDPGSGDIAFLRLHSAPEDIIPLRLGAARHSLPGNPIHAFGYPSVGRVEGIHARGEFQGIGKENNQQLLQLRSEELNRGHSGAPVWDEKRGVVIGMVVSIYRPDASGRLRDTAFAVPSETLWQVCSEIRPSETCPYLGLDTFTEMTAQYFFGRETLTEKLLDVLRGGVRLLALFGPSGSGKSSVMHAGLLPALKKGQLPDSQKWAQITMRPANNPFEQLQIAGLDPMDVDAYLKSHADFERVVLFIDQFEELFTLCPDDLRNRFLHNLVTALENPRLILIVSMRDDFYSAFNANAAALAGSKHLKIENVPGTLKRDELVAMIKRPAEAGGLGFEEGLIQLILNAMTIDGEAPSSTLPLLEFALTQLWEKRRDGLLTHEAYHSIGGVTGSLARWADDAYSNLPKTDQPLAERLLISLVHLGDEAQGLSDIRTRRKLAEWNVYDPVWRVIKHFTDRRLIVTTGESIELVHDALVREWSRLQDWLKSNRDNLRLIQGVREAAHQWQASGRDETLLNHRGGRLEDATSLVRDSDNALPPVEQMYLDACVAYQNQEQKRRERIISFLRIAFVAVLGFALIAGYQWYRAYQNTRLAQEKTNELINLANVDRANKLLKEHNPDLALALAMHTSQGARPAEKAFTTLLDAAYLSFSRDAYPLCQKDNMDIAWASNVDISPDNQWAAVGCFWKNGEEERSGIYTVDLRTGEIKENNVYPARIFSLAISPNGRQILAGYGDSSVILWDISGAREATLAGHSSAVSALAFSATGAQAVTASYDKTIILWDIEYKEIISHVEGTVESGLFDGKFTSIDYSPDETKIALGDDLGNVTVWDLEENSIYFGASEDAHSGFVMSVKFTPDSLKLYSGSADSTIAMRDVDHTNQRLDLLKAPGYGPGTWINSLALLPDGDHLLSAMSDGSILLWDLHTLQVIQHFDGHLDEVVSLDLSSDGTIAVSGARDGSIRVWDLSALENIEKISLSTNSLSSQPRYTTEITDIALLNNGDRVIVGDSKGYIHLAGTREAEFVDGWQVNSDESPITSLAVSLDESQILIGGGNGQVMLWDLGSHTASWSINQKKGGIRSTDISPDRKTALVSYENGEIILLNLNDGQTQCELSDHTNMVNSALFSPDGKHAVSGSNDHSVIWWDLENCKKSKTLYQHDSWVMNIDFSSDGKQLASVSADGSAILWDIESGRQVHRLKFPDGDINIGLNVFMLSVKFSPDGRLLATSSANGIVGLWSVANGTLLRKFIHPLSSSCTLATHCFWIWDVEFSPRADQLWSGSADGTLHSWSLINVKSTEELRTWIEKNRYLRQLSPQEQDVYDISQ